jgi:hypothetical protein
MRKEMTSAEIMDRQVMRVRDLTSMTAEQISDVFIRELLRSFYPVDAAKCLIKMMQQTEKK